MPRTQSSCSMSISSSPLPCFPFLNLARLAFSSARSEPMSRSMARLFLSEIYKCLLSHLAWPQSSEVFLTCLLSELLQSVRQLQLSLNLSPQLLHLPPALSILSPGRSTLLYWYCNGAELNNNKQALQVFIRGFNWIQFSFMGNILKFWHPGLAFTWQVLWLL